MKNKFLLLSIVLLGAACAPSTEASSFPVSSIPVAGVSTQATATPPVSTTLRSNAELATPATIWPTVAPSATWTPYVPKPTPTNWRLVPNAEVGYAAPNVTLTTLDGDTFALSDMHGKVVLINFWGIGCAGCSLSFSGMEQAFHKYSREELVILGINSFNPPDEIRREAARLGVSFPMVFDEDQTLFFDVFGGVIVPSFVFIDHEGLVQIVIVNPIPPDYLESLLASLMSAIHPPSKLGGTDTKAALTEEHWTAWGRGSTARP